MVVGVNPRLAEYIDASTGFDADACMNCGVCTAICPLGMEHLPRELFRYVVLGLDEEVRAHQEAVYSCLLCKLCEVNCPTGVHITENVRALRHYFNQEIFRSKRESHVGSWFGPQNPRDLGPRINAPAVP